MTNTPRSLNAPILLASTALVLSVLGFAVFVFVGSLPSELVASVGTASTVLSPALIASAIALLLRRSRPTARIAPWVFATLTVLGAAGVLLFSMGISTGMDDADAGRPTRLLSTLAFPIAAAAILSIGAAIAVLLSIMLMPRQQPRSVRLGVAIGAGVIGCVPVFLLMMNPSNTAVLAFGLLIALAVTAANQSRNNSRRELSPREDTHHPAVFVRRMSVLSLAIIAVVWGIGAAVGISESGNSGATTAMGVSAGVAQFAAIPLILAATAVAQVRAPQLAWRKFSGIPLVGVAVGTIIQLVAHSPEGSALFGGAAVAGISIGAWIALVLLPVMPDERPVRIAMSVVIMIGGCLVWFTAVPLSGAIALAIPAAILAFAGRAVIGDRRVSTA